MSGSKKTENNSNRVECFPKKKISISKEKSSKASESPTININFFQTPVSKIDKPVQTEASEYLLEAQPTESLDFTETIERSEYSELTEASDLGVSADSIKSLEIKVSKVGTTTTGESDSKEIDSFGEFSLDSPKKSITSISYDPEEEKSMDIKKKLFEIRNSLSKQTTSDLERRKLEAELKAAEEIAKIKQSVIEKRLAVELAAIQNSSNSPITMQPSPISQQDMRVAKKSASNQLQDLEDLENLSVTDFQNRVQAARPITPSATVQPVSSKLIESATKILKSSGNLLLGQNPLSSNPNIKNLGNLTPSSSDMRSVKGTESRKFSSMEVRNLPSTPEAIYNPSVNRFGAQTETQIYPPTGKQVSQTTFVAGNVAAPERKPTPSTRPNSIWKNIALKMKRKFKSNKTNTWE